MSQMGLHKEWNMPVKETKDTKAEAAAEIMAVLIKEHPGMLCSAINGVERQVKGTMVVDGKEEPFEGLVLNDYDLVMLTNDGFEMLGSNTPDLLQ